MPLSFHPSNGAMAQFSLLIRETDKIVAIDADSQVVQILESQIQQYWTKGLQEKKEVENRTIMKLKGNPFCPAGPLGTGQEELFEINRLFCNLLFELKQHDWNLILDSSFSLVYGQEIQSIWFFQKKTMEPSKRMACVAFRRSYRIQLINDDDRIQIAFKEALEQWSKSETSSKTNQNDLEIKMTSSILECENNQFKQCVRTGRLLLETLISFSKCGYYLMTQGNVRDLEECLFFEKRNAPSYKNEFMVMILAQSDKVRLVDAPKGQIVDAIKECIEHYWMKGFQNISNYQEEGSEYRLDRSVEFKLKGNPWSTTVDDESTAAKILLVHILQTFLTFGWQVEMSYGIQRTFNKSVFVLRRCQPVTLPHACIHFKYSDRISVLISPFPEFREMVTDTVTSCWPLGIQKSGWEGNGTIYEMKLKGNPWQGSNKDTMIAPSLLGKLLLQLNEAGWTVVASLELNHNYQGGSCPDAQTWILVQTHGQQQTTSGKHVKK